MVRVHFVGHGVKDENSSGWASMKAIASTFTLIASDYLTYLGDALSSPLSYV